MRKKASDNVVEYIQDKIHSGKWRPGMKIATETVLQQETGYGKATVREAVERLCAIGILSKHQGDGTYVKDLKLENIFEQIIPNMIMDHTNLAAILQFRKILEPACVELFVLNADDEKIKMLSETLERMIESEKSNDDDGMHIADYDFHRIICEGSRNPIIAAILKVLDRAFIQYHYTAKYTIGERSGVEEHKRIYAAILSKDSELASLLMRRHIERTMRDMEEYMKNQITLLMHGGKNQNDNS